MKVLLTTHQFFPEFSAGTEVLTLSVARELIRRGHDVHVFTGFPNTEELSDEARFDEYDYEEIHVYRFHHAYMPMGGQTSMINVGYNNQLAGNLFEKVLGVFKPDIIHFFHLNRLGTNLIDSAKYARIPSFFTPTDFWVICPMGQLVLKGGALCSGPSCYSGNCVKHFAQTKETGYVALLFKWLPTIFVDTLVRLTSGARLPAYPQHTEVNAIGFRLSKNIDRLNKLQKIISPTLLMTEKLIEYGVRSELIVQSAFGLDILEKKSDIKTYSLGRPLTIGFIGTLSHNKGCHILIKAFKMLPKNSHTLKIYGGQEDFPEYVKTLHQLADGKESIKFCGTFPNAEIAKKLSDIDILVIPSLWFENTPLVLYSAQAEHCPVIASNFRGISEVIKDGENGLLFEAGNVRELTKKLLVFINNPVFSESLSAKAQRPKTIKRYVGELLNLYANNLE